LVAENGHKSVTPLVFAPVDVRNVHLGEFLTQKCQRTSVIGESFFSLTCQTPETTNIQGMMFKIIVVVCIFVSAVDEAKTTYIKQSKYIFRIAKPYISWRWQLCSQITPPSSNLLFKNQYCL